MDTWSDLISDISARLDVLCADHEATRHLTAYLNRHLVYPGVAAINLRLPIDTFRHRRTQLERRVYATLSALHSASDPHQTYSLDLAHDFDRTSPYFSGALAIHTSLTDDCVSFVLAGQYRPSAGTIATTFDAAFRYRIAQASASGLLRTIAGYVEVASARNESARAGKRAYSSA